MELFTVKDVIAAAINMYGILGGMKDAIIGAVFTNLETGMSQLFHGHWSSAVLVLGSVVMLWRLRRWILGFLYHFVK